MGREGLSSREELGIARRRMRNVLATGAPFDSPEDVVRWFGCVQGQDYWIGRWSLGQRCKKATDASVHRAYVEGKILRTHVLRPTWQFVTPEDIRWILELTGPRVQAGTASRLRQLGLDAALLKKATRVIVRTLKGDEHLTRREFGDVLRKSGIDADASQLGYIFMHLELEGIVCSGVPKGKLHTYALLEERAPKAKSLPYDKALKEFVVRYYTSHGPATVKDLNWWSSLKMSTIREGLEMAGSKLERDVVGGTEFWYARQAAPRPRAPVVHLLQGLDEYIVGYSESRYILDLSRKASLSDLVFSGVLTLDGQFAGSWKRTLNKGAVQIEAALYGRFDEPQMKALEKEVTRYGRFLELDTSLVLTKL